MIEQKVIELKSFDTDVVKRLNSEGWIIKQITSCGTQTVWHVIALCERQV